MSISPIGTRVPTLSPNSIIRAGIPLLDNFNATDVAVTVESLIALCTASLDIASGVFTTTYADIVNINPILSNYSGVWTRIDENVSFGTQLTGELAFARTDGSFTITLPEIVNNLGNDNISFIIGTYDNVLGTEKAIIYPNIGALTATIEIEGYTAASTFNLFVTAIYKR